MVFNAVGCFNKTIIFGRTIMICGNILRLNGFHYWHEVIIELDTSISIRFIFDIPIYSVSRNITFIMSKGNCIGCICSRLIT